MRKTNRFIFAIFVCVFLSNTLISCTSETKKKERIVSYISRDMCKNISSKMSNGIDQVGTGDETVDALAITIIESLDMPLEDFCNCFTEIMGSELMSKFTYSELIELRKDKIKQMMVASKIIEQKDIQVELENCMKGTVQKTGEKYQEYQERLDDKFGK
jgi:hypothetical protein